MTISACRRSFFLLRLGFVRRIFRAAWDEMRMMTCPGSKVQAPFWGATQHTTYI